MCSKLMSNKTLKEANILWSTFAADHSWSGKTLTCNETIAYLIDWESHLITSELSTDILRQANYNEVSVRFIYILLRNTKNVK